MKSTEIEAGKMGEEELTGRTKPPYFKKIKELVFGGGRINMSNWLDILTEVYGDRASIYLEKELDYPFFKGKTITYRAAMEFVNRIGNALLKQGIGEGDRVVLITSNRVELVFACFAVMKIGAIAVPLNFMFRAPEIKYIVENCGARCVIVDWDVFVLNVKDASFAPSVEKWLIVTRREAPEGFLSLRKLMSEAGGGLAPKEFIPEKIVAILYTSGTTGFPKGALLTNEAFSRTVRREARLAAVLPTSRAQLGVFTLPVAHIMGYIMTISFFAFALPWYFISRFTPEKVLKTIEKHRGTTFVGVPTMYAVLAACGPEKYDLSSIKVWGAAGDAMPVERIRHFKRFGGVHLWKLRIPPLYFEGYGQVETVGITCLKTAWHWRVPKPGSVGRVVRALHHKIVDQNGKTVRRGEVGVLAVKGPRVCRGYWANEEANREAFLDGEWFLTGDLVRADRRGRLYFVDREKDMIKCGGYSIFSKEVEEELKNHPAVAEVGVIGIPDEMKGQIPVAVVSLKPGKKAAEDELVQWGRENIAGYKAPRHVRIVKDMPLGMTFKVDKKELRRLYTEEFREILAGKRRV
ncbi:MAG: AMP-binding protein [bacterium]